jgi:hypothetical protein
MTAAIRVQVEAIVRQALADAAGYVAGRASKPDSEEVTEAILALLSAPEPAEADYVAPWTWANVNLWLAERGYEKRRLVMPNDDDVARLHPHAEAATRLLREQGLCGKVNDDDGEPGACIRPRPCEMHGSRDSHGDER